MEQKKQRANTTTTTTTINNNNFAHSSSFACVFFSSGLRFFFSPPTHPPIHPSTPLSLHLFFCYLLAAKQVFFHPFIEYYLKQNRNRSIRRIFFLTRPIYPQQQHKTRNKTFFLLFSSLVSSYTRTALVMKETQTSKKKTKLQKKLAHTTRQWSLFDFLCNAAVFVSIPLLLYFFPRVSCWFSSLSLSLLFLFFHFSSAFLYLRFRVCVCVCKCVCVRAFVERGVRGV